MMRFTSIAHHDRCYDLVVSHVCLDAAFSSHAMFASSSSYAHGRNRPRRHHVASHAPRRASTRPTMLFIKHVMLHLFLHAKMIK
jgi:hypothetical protein